MSTTDPRARYAQPAPRRHSRLDAIPGYRGYHEKEARRDADGALRRALAADYTAQAARLTRIQQTLLAARKLADLAPADDAQRRLNHFIDRLRSATYGYAGLHDNVQVDERALDQLYGFDLALADGVDAITANLDAAERAADAGEPTKDALATLNSTVADLMTRFDARAEVFQSGQPSALIPSPLAVLKALPQPDANPLPSLDLGDAVSADGHDWIVAGRTDVGGAHPWTDYLLRDGAEERWLTVTAGPPQAIALTERVDFWSRVPPVSAITFGGVSYTLAGDAGGAATITGASGQSHGAVHAYNFTGEDDAFLTLRDWETDRQAYVGRTLLRDEVTAYPQQRGRR